MLSTIDFHLNHTNSSILSNTVFKTTHDPTHDEPTYLDSRTSDSSQFQVEIEEHSTPTLPAVISNDNINSFTKYSGGQHAHQSEDEYKSNADEHTTKEDKDGGAKPSGDVKNTNGEEDGESNTNDDDDDIKADSPGQADSEDDFHPDI